MSQADTIKAFYEAFDRHDGDAMAALYAPDVHFHDPVFQDLHGEEAGAMWRMLTSRAEDLRVELPEHDDSSAHWIAHYTFRTGRKVVNDIRATFAFDDAGRITEHRDSFDLYKWSRQALGPVGVLLGWSPIVQGKIRREARAGLDEFMGRAG